MLTLLAVGKTKTVPVLITAVTDAGDTAKYGITEGEYAALGRPAVGDVLDGEREECLLSMDEAHRAYSAAVRILSFADNTAAALCRKLRARGFSTAAAEGAVAVAIRRGYLREDDLLERSVLAAARKLWGPRRITEALAAKGFSRSDVEEVLGRLTEAGEIDFAASRRRLLEGRLHGEPPEKKKAFLYRYGF